MSKLDHPNIVRLFETFVEVRTRKKAHVCGVVCLEESHGEIHLTMELCRGLSRARQGCCQLVWCEGGALPNYARDFWPPLEEAGQFAPFGYYVESRVFAHT